MATKKRDKASKRPRELGPHGTPETRAQVHRIGEAIPEIVLRVGEVADILTDRCAAFDMIDDALCFGIVGVGAETFPCKFKGDTPGGLHAAILSFGRGGVDGSIRPSPSRSLAYTMLQYA